MFCSGICVQKRSLFHEEDHLKSRIFYLKDKNRWKLTNRRLYDSFTIHLFASVHKNILNLKIIFGIKQYTWDNQNAKFEI